MYFALAETPGGRPTTVTTAAISTIESARTPPSSAFAFLPHADRPRPGLRPHSTAAVVGPDADGRSPAEHDADGPRCTLEDYDMSSSEDEYSKSGSTFSVAVGHYVFQRNLIEDSFISAQESKAVIEYVNLKFVENNFRSLGLDQIFDKNNIMQAEQEFKSFEIWFSRVREYAVDREFIRDLRLPLFCHLYLNLYAPRNHTRLQAFLKTFEYLFTSPRGVIYLQELKNVTNVLDLSPRLAYFRRNKFVYGVSPIFISNLYDFFYPHFMLKVVFQEWFDINYTAYEDPRIIFDDYYANNLVRVNNLDKANTPKQNNNVFATKPVLCKKTLNSSQNKNNNRKLNNFENDFYNNQRPSTSKDFVGHQNSSSSHQESNSRKCANNDVEDLQKNSTNSELDESTGNSEETLSEDHSLESRSRRSKKKYFKRKDMRRNKDHPSSSGQKSRKHKKSSGEKYDDTSLLNKSTSHQENSKLSEESLGEGQNSSNQKEGEEERIILRISRKSNKLSVIVSNEKKEPNDSKNPMLEKSSEEQVSNDGKKSRNHRKKHKSRGKNKSSTDNDILLQESSNEISNDEQQLRKKIKSNDGRKSISDEDSRLFEKSSEVSDNEAKMNKRQKKNSRKKFTSDESLSEVSNNKEKKFKRQKKSDKSKSSSDNNMDISNDGEEKQKQQNKRSKSKFTSDDDNRMSEISSDEKNLQKPQKKQKLRENKNVDNTDDINLSGGSPEISNDDESSNNGRNNRGRNEHTDNDNSSLYESSFKDSSEEAPEDSSGDSSEDFSSTDSSYDEEIVMHKFVQHEKKSAQHLRYETSRRLKHTNTTKIDFKNLDEDWFLRTTHQIILKNCSKLSCSILTSDLKFVAAGSLDSLIYLWERRQQFLEEKNPDILHSIGNINPSNFASSVPGNNLMEYLDKSTAFVLRGHGGPIFDLAELPSAKILLSASNDKTYRAWDMVSKRCLEVYNEHEHRTWCIAACPYSLQVATGSCEGASCLWFLNYKRPLRIFMGHLDDILVLKFHPNQVLLATGSSDKTVRVFELTTGECHRLLMGHSDYITCLEFNAQNSNHLASASGCGEIIIWDVPSSEMVWKIKVGNKLFSDLVWLTKDILLASLTSGVVLKCDTKLNYVDSSCKVKGFETTFDRLISLQMINNTVYTIGIPDKSGGLRPIPKRSKEKTLQMKNEQKSRRESSPLSKLFFPQHIIDNDGNSMKPLHGLISTASKHPPFNYEYQLNTNNQFKKSTSPSFLNMNLRSAPFNLSADEISKLSSEYQSENIRLVPATDITNNLQNAYLLPVQQNVRTTNQNSINIHSTNDQLPSTSKSQKSNKTPGPSKSKITTAKQQNFGKSNLTMHTSIQHMQIKTTTIQEQLHIDDQRETNTLVQQYVQTTSTSTHKQQTSNLLQFTRPGMSSQLPQNSIGQQEQQQHSVGSSISVGGTNVQQQQLLQQMRSNINLTQGNVQQRLSPQTNNRSPNINVTQRPSPRQSPNQSSSDETSTGKHTRMQ
ncbi:LOW QUALITY PROTEIN: uncharacterized protein LOC112597120 [Melanaphis sacchari]|uniref:LOW QUALITY PROTEIN: uncharacterized protein LOC112597120 n=1 Tax=Melanaphis sacchari TaxID=742174 RepID=UPI000DC12E49|nr:LOW QUALITY PROTEIN: uncharacterized protein LOC112597120 [Melanaphis sacchari]